MQRCAAGRWLAATPVTGDPIAISAYLGTGTVFDNAITEFWQKYADQNESDYAEFDGAIRDGTLVADPSG